MADLGGDPGVTPPHSDQNFLNFQQRLNALNKIHFYGLNFQNNIGIKLLLRKKSFAHAHACASHWHQIHRQKTCFFRGH